MLLWPKESDSRNGSVRTVKRFLWFPKTLKHYWHEDREETRWLEFVWIRQWYYMGWNDECFTREPLDDSHEQDH